MQLSELIDWIDSTLDAQAVDDYGPNGLQVEASNDIRKVAVGVTSNLRFIEAAAEWGADLAVVHHGIYWNGASPTVTGALGTRIRTLIKHNLSLAGYHLPLDGHPELGNAVSLARELGLSDVEMAFGHRGLKVGCVATCANPITPDTLLNALKNRINPDTKGFCHGPSEVKRVGIVTGGAARDVHEAIRLQCDAFITGEAGEYSQATAYEENINFFAAGHHRTERFGPQALGTKLANTFTELDVTFIDVDNPV